MHEFSRSAVIAATPDKVWDVVGDFNSLSAWHPSVPPSTIEGGGDANTPGAVRSFAIDGDVLSREELTAYDASAYRMEYKLIQVPFPVTDYHATLQVRPHADGSEVVWSATYEGADDIVPTVEEIFAEGTYGAGLAALRERFA
ncbi:SRPBCC family protein [Streptomyces sp. SID3343]|uniref:SRPBCC family protein n=1 Tax=Streptomyces sp. SID3343 TaxID=2690260 RepID=UPI0013687205|nr:SRPBCC family protein [Streptomyces sp. SID3343]MYW06189.1 SRPBCC family protein [Streptomyces sp. SID3343]